MKKAAVPTTTARGAAVSSSRMTAVQSVYIGPVACAGPSSQLMWPQLFRPRLARLLLLPGLLALLAAPGRADVVFENCQPTADGGVSCDTRPTGDTRLDAFDARYGLLDNASPGWAEFEPFQGDDDLFGGNET